MSDIDRAELRRLLDEAELPWTVEEASPNMGGPNCLLRREGKAGIIISAHEYGFHGRGELIAAAVNALPDLLDALEKAEGHRDSLAATLIEVQREKRAIERVRELHAPYYPLRGGHPYCAACEGDEFVPYPCPTIQALDGVATDE